MIDHEKDGELHLVTMCNGANVINPAWQQRFLEVLDIVEADCGKGAALVLTGQEKFFCNGLDLEVLPTLGADEMKIFGEKMLEIQRRLLMLPCPSVAALNGHAFAAGAFLALACDYRVMREDRGWICISEVDVGVPIGEPMMGLLRGKLPIATAREAVFTGKRYTGPEAIVAGFVDATATQEKLLETARAMASMLATKEPGIFKTLKQTYFAPIAEGMVSA